MSLGAVKTFLYMYVLVVLLAGSLAVVARES
jgi:hypothetical protein